MTYLLLWICHLLLLGIWWWVFLHLTPAISKGWCWMRPQSFENSSSIQVWDSYCFCWGLESCRFSPLMTFDESVELLELLIMELYLFWKMTCWFDLETAASLNCFGGSLGRCLSQLRASWVVHIMVLDTTKESHPSSKFQIGYQDILNTFWARVCSLVGLTIFS